jgi:hypothetical protein
MRCFLRFSDESNGRRPKPRPAGFSKRKCFENFLEVFGSDDVQVVADCVKSDTYDWLVASGVSVADYGVYTRLNGDGKSRSFLMFSRLRKCGLFRRARTLVSSVPGLARHVHPPWIAPNAEIEALVERMQSAGA